MPVVRRNLKSESRNTEDCLADEVPNNSHYFKNGGKGKSYQRSKEGPKHKKDQG
jgi:hypothetical protein